MTENLQSASVAIIGAGPTGLFAARELCCKGVNVILFNRDIKPGGLAEYGIFPEKYRLKDGLRAQFHDILHQPNLAYFGNVTIGNDQPLDLTDLRSLGFSAVLIASGAQGTKWLGLPGEESQGVYHAKELVYHYNHLPPFAGKEFKIGKRVMVVGVGNVMADIVRYLASLPQVEEITTIARRGLAEVKFEKKELEPIISHLDLADFRKEVERISPAMTQICQVPREEAEIIETTYAENQIEPSRPVWRLHFLYSPVKILANSDQTVCGVQLEENTLQLENGEVKAKGNGKVIEVPIDTLIFAIGDRVGNDLGLPMQGNEYAKNPSPQYPIEGTSYEIFDASNPEGNRGIFVAGWARKPSTGLVGLARKDGTFAARAILSSLDLLESLTKVEASAVETLLRQKGYLPVNQAALQKLEAVEKDIAIQRSIPEYKFDRNDEMMRAMGL